MFVFAAALTSHAGTVTDPTVEKSLNSGPDPVGLGKDESSTYKFTITIDGDYSEDDTVRDVLPAEFDAAGICTVGTDGECCNLDTDCDVAGTCDPTGDDDGVCTAGDTSVTACTVDTDCDLAGTCTAGAMASCGSATVEEKKKAGVKLRPDHVEWELTGCDGEETLMICMNTDQNPGHGKRQIAFFEPTSCGPLVLNDGASFDEETFSDSLVVAGCVDETDLVGCVDADDDGWSIDCGDCADDNPDANPDGEELCTGGVDEDCDGDVDCNDSDCALDEACV